LKTMHLAALASREEHQIMVVNFYFPTLSILLFGVFVLIYF
jgi:hypothetical protein